MSEISSVLASQTELKRIPLKQIRTSLQNPRLIITQDMIDARAASMTEGGQIIPITVRPLSPAEINPDNDASYEIVDGEVRYRAALKLGWTDINTVIEAMSARTAYKRRIGANRTNKPIWFEDYISMEVLVNEPEGPEKMQKQEIADLFEVDNRTVSRAIRILKVLSVPSRALVLENLKKFTPNQASVLENLQNNQPAKAISENTLYRLADLGDAPAVDAALQVVLDKQMTEPQTQELVKWVQTGNLPEAHVLAPRPPRAPKGQSSKGAKPASIPELAPAVTSSPEASQDKSADKATTTTPASAAKPNMSTASMLGWDLLAGIPIAAQIRAKIKKGEKPTLGETLILVADLLYRGLHWLSKIGWKVAKWLTKALWHLFKESIKDMFRFLGPKVRKTVTFLFGLTLFIGIIWLAWDIHEHGYFHPLKVVGSKVYSVFAPKPEPVPAAVPVTSVVPAPVTNVSSQPTIVPTSEPTPVTQSKVMKTSPSPQAVAKVATPIAQPTAVKKGDAFDDLAGAVSKQAGTDVAADAAKKIFGL